MSLYFIVALIGAAVSFGEILARYPDAPQHVASDKPAWLYVALNAGAAVGALWLMRTFEWLTFDETLPALQRATWEALAAGFGGLAIIRSALLRIRVADHDIDIGPAGLLSAVFHAVERSMDQSRARHRNRVVTEIMANVDFNKAKVALPDHCFNLLQNVSPELQYQVSQDLTAYDALQSMGMHQKSLHLGLVLLSIAGEDLLRDAVRTLGPQISSSSPQSTGSAPQPTSAPTSPATPPPATTTRPLSTPYFKLAMSQASQPYRFALHAPNHEIILTSENYAGKAAAMNGIESVRENAPVDARYERKRSSDGQHMFNLTARNRQVIGTSERYRTQQGRDAGIEAVKRYAPSAEVNDET